VLFVGALIVEPDRGGGQQTEGAAYALVPIAGIVISLGSLLARTIPVGAVIARVAQLQPERWRVLWLGASVLAAQSFAEEEESWRVVVAAGVLIGFFFPRLAPDFLWWVAHNLAE